MDANSDTALIPPTSRAPHHGWPPPGAARPRAAGSTWTAWTLATAASIWIAVALISVLSPDMITGSEQQRMPVAAFSTWLWGFGASLASLFVMARLRSDVRSRPAWITLSGTTIAIWSTATLVSIFGPTMVTGSDPTTIPLAAFIAPVAAMLATVLAGLIVLVTDRLARQ